MSYCSCDMAASACKARSTAIAVATKGAGVASGSGATTGGGAGAWLAQADNSRREHKAGNLGRKGIGIELKPSYFAQAIRNLEALKTEGDGLFAEIAA